MNKKIVISNHTDLFVDWIDIVYEYGFTSDDIIIYDRKMEDSKRIEKYGKIIKSPNVGSNIYDIGRYIYENYDNLSDLTLFLKCNLLQRVYTHEKRFRYALQSNWFVPIDTYPYKTVYPLSSFVNECLCVEDVSAINAIQNTRFSNIKSIKDLLNDLFEMEIFPDHIAFCPAANFLVPKNLIQKYSKKLYKKMMDYTNYDSNPPESHMFERILYWMWSGTLIEKI